jgi:hypothetical protein
VPTQTRRGRGRRHGPRRYELSTARITIPAVRINHGNLAARHKHRESQTVLIFQLSAPAETDSASISSYKRSHALWSEPDVSALVASSPGGHSSWSERRSSDDQRAELLSALRHYVGSWVAIRGASVVVSRSSPLAIIDYLREHNIRADSVLRVPIDAKKDNIW